MSNNNTVADGYSRTDQRVPIATSTTPVAPPLDFDYNDGVPPRGDDYGAVEIDNDADNTNNNNDNDNDDSSSADDNNRNNNNVSTGIDHHLPHPDHPNLQQTHEGEHRYDHGSTTSLKITRSTKLYAFCAALNSCNLGYDIGVNTGAGMLLQDTLSLSDVQLEVFMGSLNLFAMIGALCSHWISDKFGRRWSFRVAAVIFIFGTVIQSGAGGDASLMFGRAFVGLGVGFGLAVDPGELLYMFCGSRERGESSVDELLFVLMVITHPPSSSAAITNSPLFAITYPSSPAFAVAHSLPPPETRNDDKGERERKGRKSRQNNELITKRS